MAATESGPRPVAPDPAKVHAALADIFINTQKALQAAATRAFTPNAPLPYDPIAPMRTLAQFGVTLLTQPHLLADAQMRAWQEWTALWTSMANRTVGKDAAPVIEPQKGDRRFSDPAWSDTPYFDFVRQTYLLAGKQLTELVAQSTLDEKTRAEVDFYLRQFLNAVAPTNFLHTNPLVIRETMARGGVNLLNGIAKLLADVAEGKGLVRRHTTGGFEVGVSLATTPGSVVFENELFQLIQYDPATREVAKRPVLYVPPLVNKYYLLDLQPHTSLVKWLVDQGHTVFVISWVNPDASLRDKGLDEYIADGTVAAINAIEQATGERQVDLMGFCLGGTLSAITLGYLAATKQKDRVGSATLIGTLLDFRELGEWSVFVDEGQMAAFNRYLETHGYVEAHDLERLFSLVRSNDLIWSSVVNHYLLDRETPPSDILHWFGDGARIPEAFLAGYAKQILLDNSLAKPGALTIRGVKIDLSKVTTPVMLVSLKDDHVSGWAATYAGALLFGGPVEFVLGGSGHNAGVINPPAANKHGYWINARLPQAPNAWFEGAAKKEGSWWPHWESWMRAQGDQTPVEARAVGAGKLKPIETAPGRYVRVRH
ncbi:MAG: class I poly(R)-hydroxyalkanoic acid synthase [Rhodospirillaceae bacterium]